ALCVTRVAISLAKSLAMAASMLKRAPVSCFQAALRINRRAASISVDMSASMKWMAWNCEMRWPKAMRSWEYFSAASNEPCSLPVACGAMPMSLGAAVEDSEYYDC